MASWQGDGFKVTDESRPGPSGDRPRAGYRCDGCGRGGHGYAADPRIPSDTSLQAAARMGEAHVMACRKMS